MYEEEITFSYKCRTCLNNIVGLQSLSTFDTDGPYKQETYGEILREVTNINVMEEMPQYICCGCLRKLKSSYSFIKQARKANDKFLSLLNGMGESNIDIPPCLEIKMEYDDDDEEPDCSYENSDSNCGLALKVEASNENPLSEDIKDTKQNPTPELININISRHDNVNGKYSFKGNVFSSESESEVVTEEDSIKLNAKNSQEHFKRKSIKTSSQDNSELEDTDIAVPCLQCNKVFNNSKELRSHLINTHVPENQKCSCPQCGAKFTRPYSMYYHMRTQHGTESVKGLIPARERTHQCDKCPRKYSQQKYLNFHIKTKHSGREQIKSKKSQEVAAESKKMSEVRLLCFKCGGSFPNKTQLTIHMRRHTGEMPFKCDICEKAYPRASELKYHYRIHTGEKPYKCTQCDKSFRVSAKLSSHMRSHTNERPFKCKQCERSFKYSKDLNIHTRTHTGEKPYCCNVCGSTFTQSNSLKAHRMKLGHIENNSDPTLNIISAQIKVPC